MPTTTTNYGMPLYDEVADATQKFVDFRVDVNGNTGTSAMNIIDTQMKTNADDILDLAGVGRTTENIKGNADNITTLKNKDQYYITTTGTDTYIATSAEILNYTTGMILIIAASVANTGNSTININSLGAKQLTKVDSTGTNVVLSASDLTPNRPAQFRYDGTAFRLIGYTDVPADKTYILDAGNYFAATNVESALQELGTSLKSGVTSTPTIAYGMNSKITNSGGTSVFPSLSITGQSYVNAMGKDGNCEDVSKFIATTSTTALNTSNKVFGANSIAITLTSTSGYITKLASALTSLDTSKYYLYTAYLKNATATSLNIRTTGSVQTSSSVTSTTAFTRVGILLNPTMMSTLTGFTVNVTGSSTNVGYVDGIMVNEISATDYAAGLTACLAKFPYVDSYACLQNPYLEVRHDNLVRNGNGEEGVGWWTASTANISVIIENGKFKVVTNSSGGGAIYQKVPVKKNTSYYWKANVTGGLAKQVYAQDFTTALLAGDGTFNSGTNEFVYAELIFFTASQTGYADSIQLIEGITSPTSYKPCRLERCVVEGKFTSDDTLTLENGEVGGLNWWKHKTLFGKDYAWTYNADLTGAKELICNNISTNILVNSETVIKYDGKILPHEYPITNVDKVVLFGSGQLFYRVADTDTGWSESIAPNDDEVRAFCNGWKATANNGTRYTAWASVVDASVAPNQTIDYVKAVIASSYTGYELHYRLSAPEPITSANVRLIGDIIKLDVDDNYVYLDTGDIISETANPVLSSTTYYISNTAVSGCNLRYQNDDIFAVYRNGIYDPSWTIGTTTPYGVKMASCQQASYDVNATYSTDYVILKTQAPTVGTPTLSYSQDVYTAISDLAEVVQNKQNQDSTLDALVDASLYQRFRVGTSNTWIVDASGTMYLRLEFNSLPMRTKPTIKTTIVTFGVASVDYTSSIYFESSNNRSVTGLNNRYLTTFKIPSTNTTLINAIKASGFELVCEIELNCAGRI